MNRRNLIQGVLSALPLGLLGSKVQASTIMQIQELEPELYVSYTYLIAYRPLSLDELNKALNRIIRNVSEYARLSLDIPTLQDRDLVFLKQKLLEGIYQIGKLELECYKQKEQLIGWKLNYIIDGKKTNYKSWFTTELN